MNKNFMIGFLYDGYFYCANVHRFSHDARVEYQVTVLTNKSRPQIPSSIVLQRQEQGLAQISPVAVPPAFLQTIINEIEKHGHSIH